MLYEVLKTAKMGAGEAPDLYTALLAKNLRRDGEVKTLSGIPPLTFRSNGQPLLDYLISGNTVQSGTPTPDNPVMPQGTGERTGNLWDNSSTISKGQSSSYYAANFGTPLPAGTYTFSAKVIGEEGVTACRVSFRKSNMGQIVASNIDVSPERTSITVTLNEPCYAVYMYGSNDTTTLAAVTYQDIMLNTGSSPLPYEPFGVKIPISSANTTTPVYLGEVETTRKIKKLVLTGEENWKMWAMPSGSSTQRFYINISGVSSYLSLCSHFIRGDGNEDVTHFRLGGAAYNELVFFINNNISTVADFKTYLQQQYTAGTPVTVWYVLAEPETGIVNEPLMKIGDYADTVSMEQAGVEIPTTRGTNTLDVLTDVKPSEVYIKYKE